MQLLPKRRLKRIGAGLVNQFRCNSGEVKKGSKFIYQQPAVAQRYTDKVLAPEQARGKLCNQDAKKRLAGILHSFLISAGRTNNFLR